MERGKKLKIIYQDDTRTRKKDVQYHSIDGFMFWYTTERNPEKIEGVPSNKIIRIEGRMEDGKKENNNSIC